MTCKLNAHCIPKINRERNDCTEPETCDIKPISFEAVANKIHLDNNKEKAKANDKVNDKLLETQIIFLVTLLPSNANGMTEQYIQMTVINKNILIKGFPSNVSFLHILMKI